MSTSHLTSSGVNSTLLTLEPLELYMLADDDDRYPRTFVVGLEFSGNIERTIFEEVLAEILSHEPRLTAVAIRRGLFGHAWQPSGRPPSVDWLPESRLPDSLAARRINLRCETGLRVFAVRTAAGSRMFHVFHHACCDGLGALAFLGRLYAAYSRRVQPAASVATTPVSADAIRGCRPAENLSQRIGSLSEARKASRQRAWQVLTSRTARLIPATGPGRNALVEKTPFPGSVTHAIGDRETRGLKRAARRHAATLNDLLLSAMFRTLRSWHAAHGSTGSRESYQIMVPVDLRGPEHDELPAANLVSCFFVRQPARACDDPGTLLRAVSIRTQYAVQSRSGLIMYNAIRRVTRVPGFLNLMLKAWRTQATAMVSYVGDAARGMRADFPRRRGRCLIGDLELKRITATGLVRPGTAVNLTAGIYAGELVLNLMLDPHQFSHQDAQRFLSMLVEHLLDYDSRDVTFAPAEAVAPCG